MLTEDGRKKLSERMKGNKLGVGREKTQDERDAIAARLRIMPKIDGKKFCNPCKRYLDYSSFYKSNHNKDGLATHCKECCRERHKKYYTENSEVIRGKVKRNNSLPGSIHRKRERNLLVNYGLTGQEYYDMLISQNEKCAICEVSQDELDYRMYVDHCHSTSRVRGLLCKKCNSGIGLFKDSVEIMKNAIEYLSKIDI